MTASFTDGVEEITDLKPGMVLEGTVTNVAAFGAFIDIGVHQDGLVHVSQLADKFVKDPHEIVKTGQVVKVTVVEVDVPRKRIGLTMKKDGGASARDDRNARGPAKGSQRDGAKGRSPQHSRQKMSATPKGKANNDTGALGAALMDAFKKK